MTARWIVLLAALPLLIACRADLGADDYASQEIFEPDPEPMVLPEGESRLNLGLFYEGLATETYLIDSETNHFYIYEMTFVVSPDYTDSVEGEQSDRIISQGGPWFGGGIHWDMARDLSGWQVLHVSVKSEDSTMATARVGMTDAGGTEVQIALSDYGFVADGDWHTLEIPLADFAGEGVDLSAVAIPLIIAGDAAEAGDELRIDDLYLRARDT